MCWAGCRLLTWETPAAAWQPCIYKGLNIGGRHCNNCVSQGAACSELEVTTRHFASGLQCILQSDTRTWLPAQRRCRIHRPPPSSDGTTAPENVQQGCASRRPILAAKCCRVMQPRMCFSMRIVHPCDGRTGEGQQRRLLPSEWRVWPRASHGAGHAIERRRSSATQTLKP